MSQITNITPTSGPGSGTVTSVAAAGGLTAVPNPIIAAGTILIDQTNLTVQDGTVYWDTGTQLLHTTATGTANQVLTSNGAGLAPTYQNVSASGAVTSVNGGNNITITGTATAPIVNVSGTTNHFVQIGNATNSLTSITPSTAGFVLTSNGVGADPSFQAVSASGAVTSVNGGNNITITGTATAPIVNVSGTTNHSVLLGNATNSINSLANGTTGQVLHAITGANDPVWSAVSLTADVSGILPIANGGTNASSFATTNGTVYFDGTRLVDTAVGTAGFVLTSNGASAPTYQAVSASGSVTTLHTQDGNNVTPTAGVINISGGNNLTTTGTAGPNTATISLSGITQHSLQVGGSSNALTQLGVASNGQLPIGSVGADPILATLTAGTNISITNGAGSITIAGTGAASFSWSVITANQTAAVNNGYFANKAGTLALALPAASAVGDVIEVSNVNTALGIQFTQAANQQIFIGNTNTTLGATGTLTSSATGDALKIVCRTANLVWYVTSVVGNWSVV